MNDNNINNNGHKRKLSNWQLYLKGCLVEQKDLPLGQRVSACGVQYRELKEKNPKKLEQLIEHIKAKPAKSSR